MSHARFGWRYEPALPKATAAEYLVLTEDPWNAVMGDVVIVPIFAVEEPQTNLMRVLVDDGLVANCTRPNNLNITFLGDAVGPCDDGPLTRVRIGVRRYLDIDRRVEKNTLPASDPRSTWWPHQGDFHFARNPRIGPHDKLYASVADDDWNSREGVTYTATVRLTSKTKAFRRRWEVPVAGSFVVSGDLYTISYTRFEQKPPPARYPQAMTDDELAAVATVQKRALSLN